MPAWPERRRRTIAGAVVIAALSGACACTAREGAPVGQVTRSVGAPAAITYSTIAAASSANSTRKKSVRPHAPRVPPARPIRLAIPAIGLRIGFDAGSRVGTVRSQRTREGWTITPPEATWADLQSAFWWSEPAYSVLPGDPSAGTTFVFMHACLQVTCAGNDLNRLSAGDIVRLATDAGTLTYTVRRTLRLDKSVRGIGANRVVYSYGHPNELRLVTCGYAPDGTSPFNWAVLADLLPH